MCAEQKKIPNIQLIQDVEYYLKTAESIHPDLYFSLTREAAESLKQQLFRQLVDPMSDYDFAKLMIPFVNKFNDGHTSLGYPQSYKDAYNKGPATAFPLEVAIISRHIFSTETYTNCQGICIGDEIISINNIPSREIIDTLLPLIGGELETRKMAILADLFSYLLCFVYGWENRVTLKLCRVGRDYEAEVQYISCEQRKQQVGSDKKYDFAEIDKDVGLITLNSMEGYGRKEFKTFLRTTFDSLKRNNIANLVIDIRKNSGGHSIFSDMLLHYIADKPYKPWDKLVIKTSRELKQETRERYLKWYLYPVFPLAYLFKYTRTMLLNKENSYTLFESTTIKPKNNGRRFNGKLYLLTSNKTYSVAALFTATFKYYKFGTIIGDETSQPCSGYFSPVKIELPNSKLKGAVSSCQYYFTGFNKTNGDAVIQPDYIIKKTREHIRDNKDAALEYTLKLIKSRTTQSNVNILTPTGLP